MNRLYTILHREVSNTSRIHLYNEDGRWCAYEKSACHLVGRFPGCRLERVVDTDTEVVLLRGVLGNDALPVEGNYLVLDKLPPLEDDIFNHWKSMMLKMKTLNYIVL